MLVDTDVMIWHLRGYPSAALRLDQLEHNLTVLTGNVKHFRVVDQLRVEKFEPV